MRKLVSAINKKDNFFNEGIIDKYNKLHFSFNFLTNFTNHLSVTLGQDMKTGSHYALLGGRVSGTISGEQFEAWES